MARIEISVNDVLDALRGTAPSRDMPKGAYTMETIAEALGISRSRATERVRRLWKQGHVEVFKVNMVGMMPDRMYPVPAYRFLKKPK